eukprot:PhF_6_TR43526/c0_g1_i1/m.66814
MQTLYNAYLASTQSAVRVATFVLHVDAEQNTCFLPWDILDDLADFLTDESHILHRGGVETLTLEQHLSRNQQETFLKKMVSTLTDARVRLLGISHLDEYFLSKSPTLLEVDFLGGSYHNTVRNVSHGCLFECKQLTVVDFSGLSGVTTIGNYVLSACHSLTALDTSGLLNVTSIGKNFL